MPFEDLVGKGTLRELFEPPDPKKYDEVHRLDPIFAEAVEGRDSEVDQLIIDLFLMTGIKIDDTLMSGDSTCDGFPEQIPSGWYHEYLGDDPSDGVFVLFKDGKPVAGAYFSFRGVFIGLGYLFEEKLEFRSSSRNPVWVGVESHQDDCLVAQVLKYHSVRGGTL